MRIPRVYVVLEDTKDSCGKKGYYSIKGFIWLNRCKRMCGSKYVHRDSKDL